MGEDPAAAHPGGPNAPRKSSIPAGGFAGINARTREMAAAKLPPLVSTWWAQRWAPSMPWARC